MNPILKLRKNWYKRKLIKLIPIIILILLKPDARNAQNQPKT